MFSSLDSGCVVGVEGVIVKVEVDVATRGFPSFSIVGLPNKSVEEAKDRIRTALSNSGFGLPEARITVNLAPADIPKTGSGFDLPMIMGMLIAQKIVAADVCLGSFFVGELSLDGAVRPVSGILPLLLHAKKVGLKQAFIPHENMIEAQVVKGINMYPVTTIMDLINHVNGKQPLPPVTYIPFDQNISVGRAATDFADIRGQKTAKRMLEIAAAGFHNVHLKGSPGAGKTMLAAAFAGIVPLLTEEEMIEVCQIYSSAGMFTTGKNWYRPPYRAPHHTISRPGLIGGGSKPIPGEITLAHRGILFLDELPEFPRNVLEVLRQPLEEGTVTISRAQASIQYPCRFQFISASNPCPCGYLEHPQKECICSPQSVQNYKKRISGPLLDRIDLHLSVLPVQQSELFANTKEESSAEIQKRVLSARTIQRTRFANSLYKTNAEIPAKDLEKFVQLDNDSREVLKLALTRLQLSARAYTRVLKVARTIADLDFSDNVKVKHIAESLQYRIKSP